MQTIEIEAKDLRVGDLIHNNHYGRNEVTRLINRGYSVTVLLDHSSPHTFRNVHELLTVDRNSQES
jgi:hypothetical protein